MPLFDAYLMVDWSASSARVTGADSIWWAFRDRSGGPTRSGNPPSRSGARAELVELFRTALAKGLRVLAGFDFPFGYPRGTARLVTGTDRWDALWAELARLVEDGPDNVNNRFAVAAELNRRLDGNGPFWGHPHQHGGRYPGLSPTRPTSGANMLPLKRLTEERISGAKTVWQLSGAGSVGGQTLLGIPFLHSLKQDPILRDKVSVWPFETGLGWRQETPVLIAEIYPSIIKVPKEAGVPHDRAQVRSLAEWFSELDERGSLQGAFELNAVPDQDERAIIVREEGFILGTGCSLPRPRSLPGPIMFDDLRDPAEITRRSFEIIAAEAGLASLPDDIAPIATRLVHASGMPDIIPDLAFSPRAGETGLAALAAGGPLICDVRMVASGVMTARLPAGNSVHVAIDEPRAAELASLSGQTRTAAGLECLADKLGGAVVAIGNAPTALFRLLELVAAGAPAPALVLGFPVGFVGAAESKEALAANALGIPFITLRGRRGGSAMAAAAANALILAAGSR